MNRFRVGFCIVFLVALCLPVVGQTQLLVDVPFNFVVGDKSMPAGEYRVSRTFLWSSGGWRIHSRKNSAAILTNEVRSPHQTHRPSMVFVRTNGGYSLAHVWTSEHEGHELQLSPSVKTIILTEEKKSIKSPQYVEIAGK